MKIQKIGGNKRKSYVLEIEFSHLTVRRMDVTEVALAYAVFVENINKLAHYKVTPHGRKVKKNRDGKRITRLVSALGLKPFRRVEAEAETRDLAVDDLRVIDIAHRDLTAFVGEPAARAADYPILNNICVVVENRDG